MKRKGINEKGLCKNPAPGISPKKNHMTPFFKVLLTGSIAASAMLLLSTQTPPTQAAPSTQSPPPNITVPKKPQGKIQVAILLDVSNSMDGLINQAKTQLWNLVSTLGKAQCDGVTPQIELALYEYGRSSNELRKGYVKQISGFSSNLDQLSIKLFGLTTNGGDEYCGTVIQTALKDLPWDSSANNYKVIFIAGNEDFLQGPIHYTKSCSLSKNKGVIVNTIYCGDRLSGIREHWNLGGECGSGSFSNIETDAQVNDIPTPYDDQLITLNNQLNTTYIGYGTLGYASQEEQKRADQLNISANKSGALKRISVKGKKELYRNGSWDLVDAVAADSMAIAKIDKQLLPDSLRNKTKQQIQLLVVQKNKERTQLQLSIQELSANRERYLVEHSNSNNKGSLQTAMDKAIREQASRFNMKIID